MSERQNTKMRNRRFVVLFPACENVCLIKDVGMIPWILYKNYQYETTIVTYKNEEAYSYLNEIIGVKLEFLKDKFHNAILDGGLYLFYHARKIDVLQLYHPTSPRNYFYIILYKLLNPRGKIYLKMDLDKKMIEDFQYNKKGFRGAIKRKILSYCDIISSEMKQVAEEISKDWGKRIDYIPNGYYQKNNNFIDYSQKENVICTVGRIGDYQKGTDILLEGFKKYAQKGNWKLRIIGKVEDSFCPYLEKFKEENEELFSRITFTGKIEDRLLLEQEYAKAKIFCLPSRFESCGIVYLEAMRNGCYIISTEVDPINELLKQKYGTVIQIDDVDALSEAFCEITNNEALMQENCVLVQEYVKKNFDWNVIGKKINRLISW